MKAVLPGKLRDSHGKAEGSGANGSNDSSRLVAGNSKDGNRSTKRTNIPAIGRITMGSPGGRYYELCIR